MAIIKNSNMDNAHKSVGMFTYRTYGGRTIVSSRVTENKSKTPAQQTQRYSFGTMAKVGAALRELVKIGFDPLKNATRHSHFVHLNSDLSNYLKQHLFKRQTPTGLDCLPKALGDPTFFGHIIAARGNLNAQSRVWLDEEKYPEGYVTLSRPFRGGDVVTLFCYGFYQNRNSQFVWRMQQEIVLSAADATRLIALDTLPVNRQTFPSLRSMQELEEHVGTFLNGVATVVVRNGDERSTAYFSLIETK